MFTATSFIQQDIVRDGLILWLDANDKTSYPGSGTIWKDLSKGGNDGILTNGPTFNSGNGGSIEFDGVNDYVNFINTTLDFNAKDFSILCWFSTTDTNMRIIQTRNVGALGSKSGWQISVAFTRSWSNTAIEDTNGNFINFSSFTDLSSLNGQFYLVGLTWKTSIGQGKLYINNNLKSTQTNSSMINSNINSTDNLQIGRANSNTQYLNGKIPQSLIYNRALTEQEILQNYNATKGRYGL
jgi:hypothetical protein